MKLKTSYDEIVKVREIGEYERIDLNSIADMASREGVFIKKYSEPKRLLLCINVQKDFMKYGSMPISGANKDVENITKFIYNNFFGLDKIVCNCESNLIHQIFHPCWWRDNDGNHPEPNTIITYQDFIKKKWIPEFELLESIKYLCYLDMNKSDPLRIRPYHCIEGAEGCSFENEFAKMILFHSIVHEKKVTVTTGKGKGFREMRGIIHPECEEKSKCINYKILQLIKNYDEIYLCGETVNTIASTVRQIFKPIKGFDIAPDKITILRDCTSPLQESLKTTTEILKELSYEYNIKILESTDIIF